MISSGFHRLPDPSHTTSRLLTHENTATPVVADVALTVRAGSYMA